MTGSLGQHFVNAVAQAEDLAGRYFNIGGGALEAR